MTLVIRLNKCSLLLSTLTITPLISKRLPIADGNIFQVKTKGSPVTVERLDIHMSNTGQLEVWYRPGEVDPFYADSYQNALDQQTIGSGKDSMTSLPSFASSIVIPANTAYTFYVTGSVRDSISIWYDLGTEVGQTYASDEYLEIGSGYALAYAFVGHSSPRNWNGTFVCLLAVDCSLSNV